MEKNVIKEESKPIKKKTYKYYLKSQKLLCNQVITLLILLFFYIHLLNNNVYDFVIYFCFGIFIIVLSGSSLIIITKNNILKSIEFNKRYYLNSFNFLKNYLDIGEKNICLLMFLSGISWHILFPLIALYYVKNYITKSKKTKNSIKLSILLYIIYVLFNIFILNTFKVYNKSLKIKTTEARIIVIFSSVAYIALLYYFETIKNIVSQNIIVYEGGS